MRPKFDPSKSFAPRPGRARLPIPAGERAYSYFVISLPSDVTNPDIFEASAGQLQDVLSDRCMLACTEAEERGRTWCVPAWWNVVYDDGDTVVVRRTSCRVR